MGWVKPVIRCLLRRSAKYSQIHIFTFDKSEPRLFGLGGDVSKISGLRSVPAIKPPQRCLHAGVVVRQTLGEPYVDLNLAPVRDPFKGGDRRSDGCRRHGVCWPAERRWRLFSLVMVNGHARLSRGATRPMPRWVAPTMKAHSAPQRAMRVRDCRPKSPGKPWKLSTSP